MKHRLFRPYKRAVYPSFCQLPGYFTKGNTCAAAENLTPDANARRFAGLCKTWKKHAERDANGGKVTLMSKERDKLRSPRIRLRTTVAREAREIQSLARTHASQAMRRMAEIINDPHSPDNIAVAAAEVIFNRAYGKPNQTNTNLNVDANGKHTEVSGSELNQRIAEALKRVEAIAGRAPKETKGKKQSADLRKLDRNTHGPDERLN
jgi:hypothetical protein